MRYFFQGKNADWLTEKASDAFQIGVNAVVDTADAGVNAVSETVENGIIFTNGKLVEGAKAAQDGFGVVKDETVKIGAKIKNGVSETKSFFENLFGK